MVCVFARKVTGGLASLVEQIDAVVERNQARKMAAFVVLLTDDTDAAEQQLKTLAADRGIEHVPLTVYEETAGPPEYAIAPEAAVTVMMWGGEKKLVRVNHTTGDGRLDESFIAKVVADASIDKDAGEVVSVGVFNTRISPERLKQLGTLKDVESLDLQDTDVRAAGLKHLQGLTQLRSLNLFRNKRLTDDGVETLIAFNRLQELNISSTQISNTGLDRLAKHLTRLKKLNFRNSRQIDDAGLAALLQRSELEVLLCGNTMISNAGMASIGRLESLVELEVRKAGITDDGLVHVRKLAQLRKLNCSDNNITDEGVRPLSGLAGLSALDLSQTRIGNDALKHLANLKHLEQLDLSRTRITGNGLRHLHRLQKLRFINLFGTAADDAAVADLQQALPDCEILH